MITLAKCAWNPSIQCCSVRRRGLRLVVQEVLPNPPRSNTRYYG